MSSDLRTLKREMEKAGVKFVKENEPGTWPRVGTILARSSDGEWIAVGPSGVDPDLRLALQRVLDAVASNRL